MRGLKAGFSVVLVLCAGPTANAKDEPEYSRKAKLLLTLLPYVQWRSQATWGDGPFQIAVLGKSEFGPHLNNQAGSLTIHHRQIRVRYVSKPGDAEGCQALFICASEAPRIESILTWAKGRPILTLSDDEAMARRGVMVNLVMDGSFVRMVVNPETAAMAGLFLGSEIQANARIIAMKRAPS